MTPEELAALSKQMYWATFESGLLKLSDLPVLEDWMKVISALDAEVSSLNSKLDGIVTRLSTLELGLVRLIESHSIMLQQEELRNLTQFS